MGEQQDAFSYQGIERVIPLRVIMVQPTNASADQVTWDNLVQSVRVANDAFRAAGVQFRLRSVRRYTMPNFANDLTAASPGYTVAKLTWADAKADLDLAFGNISGFPSLPSSTYLKFKKEWLFYASTRFAPSDEHVVWVVGANGCCHESAVTYHARGTIMVGGGMANWSKLAHELGHSYGLMHSLGTTPAANMQCDPSGASECDMYNPPLVSTTLADFWDQVYKPGTNATTDPHKTFNNRTEANAELSNLKWIFDGANCTTSYTGAGSISCSITTGYSETWTTANAYGQNRLKGLAFPFPGGKFSGNAIVSNLEPVNNAANTWPVSFSSSQIDLIRKNLRYDTKIQSGAETDLASLGLTGGRPMLGQLLRREPLADLDFDGDGKRDIAMWFASSGEFNYKKSSSSWAQSVISLGQVGDIPVPADYNGDGVTDFAVFRPPSNVDNDTATATWYWCNSSTSTTPATHTCSGSSAAFGRREDVPIPGTNFDGDSTTPEIAVFRPSDGKVYVSYLGTANSLTINTNWSANQPAPYFGHFDIDNRDGPYLQKTDVALYDPDTATFRLLLSTGNWTGSGVVTRDFCVGLPTPCKFLPQGSGTSAQRAGAVPVFGLRRYATHSQINRTRPLGALALWDPSDKTWNVQWQPTASSALTTHMWGDLGDVLVGDGVGMAKTAALAQNGKTSDLVVYRSESNAGPGELWRCPFTSGGLFCDSGTQQTISVPEGTKSTAAFSLSDFGGDDKPELCTLSANNSTVSCYTSDSGYASSVVLTFSQLGGTFL